MREFMLCGKSIRTTRGNRDVFVLHFLGDDLKLYTLLTNKFEWASKTIGTNVEMGKEDLQYLKLERLCKIDKEEFEGPVRGHLVTYHPRFGIQTYVYVPTTTSRGERLIQVLTGERSRRRCNLRSEERVKWFWREEYASLTENYRMGRYFLIKQNNRTKRYEPVAEYDDNASVPDVGTESDRKFQPSAAR